MIGCGAALKIVMAYLRTDRRNPGQSLCMAFSRAQWFGGVRKALIGIGTCLFVLCVALVLAPPWYESTARVKVEPPDIVITNSYNDWPAAAREGMQARVVLFPVITNLNLCQKWARSSISLQVE